ncbi:helix-turn-helix domain-containing protein [Azohydromonas caseinilytica]|uniref:Helix-turn-helix domain-containing protein n=1 Tax=Azohydromonas caseinilytica TaxID=2728836 RepID=A0A848FA25_9BURK|nr:helix-turn-helix domain-containing protein [Azohydromonas caseinilytica]NML16394.1 helix-turn-helix domain-containing protein [Azohydromonas caseinilytica]
MVTASPAPRRRTRAASSALPAFALYGEAGAPNPLLLHVESIHSRSRLYDWEIEAHVHQGLHQVLWVRRGTVEARLDESRIAGEGPVALVIPPGVAHAFRFSRDCEGYVLTVNAGLLAEGDAAGVGDALQTLFAAPRALALAADAPELPRLQALFDALHAEHAGGGEEGPVPSWLARALVWRLAQLGRREDQQAARRGAAAGRQPLYTRWVVLMESHYREHWPVSRYAERLGLSTERLNRMVRAETGHNAQALLHARLAREACRRLVHVAAPVSRLAFELGFEDPAYFCRFFKRQTGLAPSEFRQKALQAGAEAADAGAKKPAPLAGRTGDVDE